MADNGPQIENGYTRIADEIIDALARYRIPGEQMQCLFLIIRKTYGYNKKVDSISLSQFVDGTGLKKPTVCRALRELKEKNLIIIKNDNGGGKEYRFNKHYGTWRPLSKKIILSKKITNVIKNDNKPLSFLSTTKDNIDRYIYNLLFCFWNEQKIIVHRKPNRDIKTALKKALKDYEIEDIIDAFFNYSAVVKSKKHYFSHKWTLKDFINRGLPKFVNEADPLNNFLDDKFKDENSEYFGTCPGCGRPNIELTEKGICLECTRKGVK